MANTTFNNIPKVTSVNSTDYLVGYRPLLIVNSVTINSSSYGGTITSASVTFVGGNPIRSATGTVQYSGNSVTGITMVDKGQGYQSTPTAQISVTLTNLQVGAYPNTNYTVNMSVDTAVPPANSEIQITVPNLARYINSNYTYTSAVNTNQLIGSQPVSIDMHSNAIINCKNTLKAWVSFNGFMNSYTAGNVSGSNCTISVNTPPTTSTAYPSLYVYPITITSTGIKNKLPLYSQITITNTTILAGTYQIQSFPSTDSFTINYISSVYSGILFPPTVSFQNQSMMASYNVTSVTYVAAGHYIISFNTNTFNDSNYACMGGSLGNSCNTVSLAGTAATPTNKTTSSVNIYWNTSGNGDSAMVFFAAVGN